MSAELLTETPQGGTLTWRDKAGVVTWMRGQFVKEGSIACYRDGCVEWGMCWLDQIIEFIPNKRQKMRRSRQRP